MRDLATMSKKVDFHFFDITILGFFFSIFFPELTERKINSFRGVLELAS